MRVTLEVEVFMWNKHGNNGTSILSHLPHIILQNVFDTSAKWVHGGSHPFDMEVHMKRQTVDFWSTMRLCNKEIFAKAGQASNPVLGIWWSMTPDSFKTWRHGQWKSLKKHPHRWSAPSIANQLLNWEKRWNQDQAWANWKPKLIATLFAFLPLWCESESWNLFTNKIPSPLSKNHQTSAHEKIYHTFTSSKSTSHIFLHFPTQEVTTTACKTRSRGNGHRWSSANRATKYHHRVLQDPDD